MRQVEQALLDGPWTQVREEVEAQLVPIPGGTETYVLCRSTARREKALPLDQALQYAIEIADALDKAHRQGITHRDLKPGKIMLTKTGAKLLTCRGGLSRDSSTKVVTPVTRRG